MASTESPKEIVRVEYDCDAGTCEGEVLVCADGSRWKRTFDTSPRTAVSFGRRVGNQIVLTG